LAALVVFASLVIPVVLSRSSVAQSPVPAPAGANAPAQGQEQFPAAAAHAGQKSLLQIIKAGGLLMIPLGCCSFVAMVFCFERAISLRRGRVIPKPFVKRFFHQLEEEELDRDQALALCEQNGSPIALVLAHGVRKWGRPAAEMEQALVDGGERAVSNLRRYLRVLNAIATISPLLGLQGTVFGMIRSFNDIASSSGMGRPELLAGGIGEALMTTAAGLTVAIPSLVAYLYFLGRIDRLTIDIDALGQELVDEISAEALAENAKPRPATVSSRRAA
jgi:biopolymer transport protein ExbB